jgi:hypothetical protein
MAAIRRVCVFCGSREGASPAFGALAGRVGRAVVRRGWGVVYGGAKVGTMGAVADAALAEGGEVYGVLPERLSAKEVAHDRLTELFVVESMHARKAMMSNLSDAFLALPGGWGTLEEVFEVLTWNQLGYVRKPVGFVNPVGFWDHLLAHADHAVKAGFLDPAHRALAYAHEDPEVVLEHLATVELPPVPRWMDRP